MPIAIGWLIKGRVSYYHYTGDVSAEELQHAADIGIEFLEQCEAPVLHTVQNTENMTSFPTHLMTLIRTVRASLTHPKMGWMLSVGIYNPFTKYLSSAVSSFVKTHHRIFDTNDEAIRFLVNIDRSFGKLTVDDIPDPDTLLYYIEGDTVQRRDGNTQ